MTEKVKKDWLPTFQAFDAVKVAFPEDYAEVRDFYAALAPLIEALPQREHIPDDVADSWLRRTFTNEVRTAVRERTHFLRHRGYSEKEIEEASAPTRKDYHTAFVQTGWHIRRASGIGGSEIGDAISSYKKEVAEGFSNATNIVRSKLLLDTPLPAMDQLQRGHRMEDSILDQYDAAMDAVSDAASLDMVRGHRVKAHPWIIGTPDDFKIRTARVNGEDKKRRIIIDSKAPSADVVKEYLGHKGVPQPYVAQLHHYGIVSHDRGIKFSGYELVPFNPATGRIEVLPVPHDRAMVRDIVMAAEWVWEECVLKGVVPEPLSVPEFELSDEDKTVMSDILYEYQSLKSLGGAIEDTLVNLKGQMESVGGNRIGKFVPEKGYGEFKSTLDHDLTTLLNLAEGVDGFDKQRFRKPGKKLDAERVERLLRQLSDSDNMETVRELVDLSSATQDYAEDAWDVSGLANALTEAGVDVSPAHKWKTVYAATRKKKGAEVETLARFNDSAETILSDLGSYMREPDFREKVLVGVTLADEAPSEDDEIQPE